MNSIGDGKRLLQAALRGMPPVMVLLLSVTAILLFIFQYYTLSKFTAFPPSFSHVTFETFAEEVRARVGLGGWDLLLGGMITVSCLVVLILEIWRRRLTEFLDPVFTSNSKTLWLLVISSIVFARFYLAAGKINWAGDGSAHLAYVYVTSQAMARGELPIWTNYLGLGSPYLQLYGFLFFYLVGAVDLLVDQVDISLKVVMLFGHVLSGVGMFSWVCAATDSRRAGFVAGIAFVLGFWHTQQVLVMGRFPLSLFYGLAPWPFFFLERSRCTPDRGPWMVLGGIALGLLALTHPGYGFWITIFFGLYWLTRTWCDRATVKGWRDWIGGPVILGLGVILGAFMTLGIWTERKYTGLSGGFDMSSVPDPTVGQVFGWSNFRFFLLPPDPFHWYGGYLGLSLAAIAVVGIWCWCRHHKVSSHIPMLAGTIPLLLALLLVFGYRLPLLQAIPFVTALNAGRYLLFVLLFLAFVVGCGAHVLLARNPRLLGGRLCALMVILIVLDLGATTFQQPYRGRKSTPTGFDPEIYEPFSEAAEAYHSDGKIPNYRIVWLAPRVHPFLAMGRLLYKTDTPTPMAPSGHVLLAVPNFYKPFEKFASELMQDLDSDGFTNLYKELRAGFALMNTRFTMATQKNDEVMSFEWKPRTEVLVSPRTSRYPDEQLELQASWMEASLDTLERFPIVWLARNMKIDFERSTCERIYLLEGEEDLGTAPTVEVLNHTVHNQRVELQTAVSDACFMRLPYAYYPHLTIKVNGFEIPFMQTATHFIAIKLNQGINEIVIEPRLSPLRRILLAVDLVMLCAGAVIIWCSWGRRRSSRITS